MANPYFSCAVEAWRSGQTLYGRMHYWRSGSYFYQDSSFPDPTMNLGGTVYTDTAFGNAVRSGIYVGDVYTTTFSRTVSGSGDRTVTFSAGSGQRSDFAGTWSAVVNFPVQYTAPDTPTVSASILASNPTAAIEVTWGTTSFGNPSSGTVYLYGGTSASPSTQFLSKTTTGNSTFVHNEPLIPNTRYYYRARACNSQLCSSYSSDATAITRAIPPVITLDSVTQNSVTFTLSAPSQGSARTLVPRFKIDSGSWESVPNDQLPATITKTFSPGTTHTISTNFTVLLVPVSDTSTATFTTKIPLYGSVNGESKAITKFYGSVNGESKLVEHLYGPEPRQVLTSVAGVIQSGGAGNITAFDGETFYDTISQDRALNRDIIESGLPIESISYTADMGEWSASVHLTGLLNDITVGGSLEPINDPADLGLTVSYTQDGTDLVGLTGTYETQYFTKLIF